MRFYLEFILKHRLGVLLGLSFVSLMCLLPLKDAVVASSISRMFFGESPDYARYLSHGREYSRDEVIVIALEHVDLFDTENAKHLRSAIDEIETLEDVAFLSGAALNHLYLVLGHEEVPQALLRDRLALHAAEACMAI